MKMNKLVIGFIVGLSLILLTAFTYKPFKPFGNYYECDVRLVTVDEHEYVIVVSKNSISSDSGPGVGITHHFGCKKCNLKVDKTVEVVETSRIEERN